MSFKLISQNTSPPWTLSRGKAVGISTRRGPATVSTLSTAADMRAGGRRRRAGCCKRPARAAARSTPRWESRNDCALAMTTRLNRTACRPWLALVLPLFEVMMMTVGEIYIILWSHFTSSVITVNYINTWTYGDKILTSYSWRWSSEVSKGRSKMR